MSGLARWCFRHRFVVIASWVLVVIGLGVAKGVVGSAFSNQFSLSGTDSTKATDLLQTAFKHSSGDVDTVVFHSKTGTLTTPAIEAEVNAAAARIARVPQVGSVVSPFSPGAAAQISKDQTIAYANVTFSVQSHDVTDDNANEVIAIGSALRSQTLEVEFGGQVIDGLAKPSSSKDEGIGLLAAAVIMSIAFASLFATLIPLIAAILALGSALLTIDLLSNVISIGSIGPIIAALVGLGVGVDYALFVVTRHRNGIQTGLTPEEAAVAAMDTSGRAVLFAGATVTVAMLGLLILGLSFLSGIGISAAIMVAFAVAVASTLLPALFGLFGMRVLSRKQRARLRADGPSAVEDSGAWSRWAGFVQKRPVPLAIAAGLVMLVLAVPFFSLRLGSADDGNNPKSDTTRQAYDLLATAFGPGYNGPLQVVAEVPSTAAASDLDQLAGAVRTLPGVASVAVPPAAPGATVRLLSVTPTTSPESVQTSRLIDTLRKQVVPRFEHDGLKVYVGGGTATFKDFASVISGKLLYFIGIIVLLGCLLLMLAFRSIVIPLTAAVMNLLSVGAAFGIVVAVFQYGWGSSTLGAGSAGPIESFLPAIMISILFGLSMDYEVFLVSRMHEEWLHSGDNKIAVRRGQAATGRVITAAAAIMVCVFLAFVFGGMRVIAEFGVGLASAILLDALVVRTVLVPAVMQLFGKWNWYLPAAIDRVLPHLSVEGPSSSESPRDERELVTVG